MSQTVIWASEAPESSIAAPSVEKQKQGWVREAPPHEWLNWHMNRTDARLHRMEEPWTSHVFESLSGTRPAVIPAGEKFTLTASYIVGSGQLRVFLDGLLCHSGAGVGKQYQEFGQPGEPSSHILWNDPIDPVHDIRAEIPVRAAEKTGLMDAAVVTLDQLTLRVAQTLLSQGRLDSAANSRSAEMAVDSDYTVPAYTVGKTQLKVFVDGKLCLPGVEYVEKGAANSTSTAITWKKAVPVAVPVTVMLY